MGQWAALKKYVKAAFMWRWNLLAFGAGVVFALMSPWPDAVLALVAACELSYLGLLTSHPRFRKAVDVMEAKSVVAEVDQTEALAQIREALNAKAWNRFESLRNRCVSLNNLSRQFRGPQAIENATVAELQTNSLERLLWLFLKLLYSQDALQRFLDATDRSSLERQYEAGLKELDAARSRERGEKLVSSLQDKVNTLKQRLDNYDRAQDHRDFLAAEIDRIEQKVSAISEMAINSRDPSDISAQVDGIAEGVSATEDAIRTLDVAPVFTREEAPKLLSQQF